MVAFRVRPRVPRPLRVTTPSAVAIGSQRSVGFCSLDAQGGALQCKGVQRSRGRVNLLTLVGTQRQRGLVTPDILCFGKQATSGQCAVQGGIAGQYVLSPDITVRWAEHQATGDDSSTTQLGGGSGARLLGGSAVSDSRNGLAYWSFRPTTGDWDMSFTTKKLDATSPASSALTEELLLLYFGCRGVGTNPTDVSAWAATTNPWSHNYRANLKGAALTLYNMTDANAAEAHTVALGIFKGDDTRTNVAGATSFPMAQGVVYTWTVQRRGETVSVSATDGATIWADSFTAPAGAPLSTYADAGNVGLVVTPQRQVEVGDLTVTDNIVSVGNWPNGYPYRALVEIAPQPDLSGTLANVVLRLTADVLAATALKTTGNGGKVQSPAGWDIRLEPYGAAVGAGKLDHQFVTPYSPTAGAIDLRFRAPSWDVTTPYRLWLYAGKAGLVASEGNPTGLWQGAMRATRLDTGADLSGGGRDLTPNAVSVVGSPTLAGMPAGRFGTASYCRRANPTYAQGLGKVSSELIFQIDTVPAVGESGNAQRNGGTSLSAETHSRYGSWITAGGLLHAGANWYDAVTQKQNNEEVVSASAAIDTTLSHVIAVRESGKDAILYVRGVSIPATVVNAATSGIINSLANDEDTVGAGEGAQTTALPGLYALDVQWPAALSAAFVAMRYRSEVECRSVAGMGAFDAFGDTDQGPVAVPLRAANAGAQQDYDVVPGCFDPDGDPITLASVGASTHAGDTTSLTGGKVRYKPQPSWPGGTAEVPFTIGDGRGKTGSARLWLAVRPSIVVVGNEGLAPAFPASTATIKGPVAVGAIQATYNALTASEIAGGATILVTPGSTGTVNLTLARNGAKGTGADDKHPQFPITIRVGTLSGGLIVDPARFPAATIAGSVTFSGDYNSLRGFTVTKGLLHAAGAVGNRTNRCYFTGVGTLQANFFEDDGDSLVADWCEWANFAHVGLQHLPHNGAKNFFVYRCYFHDQTDASGSSGTLQMLGTSDKDSKLVTNSRTRDCFYGAAGTATEAWEAKSSGATIERCATTDGRFLARHGQNNKYLALYASGGAYMGFRGQGHLMADCVTVGTVPRSWGPYTGNVTYDKWYANAGPSGWYPRGENVRIVRCDHPVIGDAPSGVGTVDWPQPPSGTELWNCTGTVTKLNGATVLAGDIHAGDPSDVPPRTDGGALLWVATGANPQVGPNGAVGAEGL